MAPVTRKALAEKRGSDKPVAAEPAAPKISRPRRGVVNPPSPPKRAREEPKEEEEVVVIDDDDDDCILQNASMEVIDVEDHDEKCRMIRIIIRALRAELGVKKEKRSKTINIKQEPQE